MNLIETMLSAANSGVGQQLASQFGLKADQVGSVVAAASPLLAGGLKEKLASGNAGGLLDILKSGNLQRYTEDPAAVSSPAAAETGQTILSHLFGEGNALSNVVSTIAEKTGIGSGTIQSILPVVTSLFMGSLAKHATGADGQIDTGTLTNLVGSLTGEHRGVFDALKTAAGKLFG
ncbi:MAG: DUF937 domain-containing protein [Bryobacteraceae bacterium]